MSEKSVQSKVVMALVCWFVGVFGIHRLLMGHSNWWIQLITFGGCGFWALYDLIMILTGSLKMADGRELS
jgi:TM2 domain-containing membrane protein YozV